MIEIHSCMNCPLWRTRRNQVVGRGSVPAEILLIGEAPGKSEDIMGVPFYGRSGVLLNRGLQEVEKRLSTRNITMPTYYITNLIECIPYSFTGVLKSIREPSQMEIERCERNLNVIIRRIMPVRIVTIGALAKKYMSIRSTHSVVHPSFVLRQGGSSSPVYLTFLQQLEDAFSL